MTDVLDEFIDNNQKYLSLQDGESWTGFYEGATKGINSFGNEAIFYKLRTKSNRFITWQNATTRVAIDMKKFKQGDCLKITRTGSKENPPTRYEIKAETPF